MSIAGVRSNRGDGYQTLVAFDWALTVLSDEDYQWLEIDSITYDVDDVVVGKSDGVKIACQCKKNQTDFKAWAIADLADELDKAVRLLASNRDIKVRFYSRNNFGDLAKLKEHAETQSDENNYRSSLGKEHRVVDGALSARLVSSASSLSSFEFLCRTSFVTSDDMDRMMELLHERLRNLVSNPDSAFNALWTRLDQLGARIARDGSSTAPQHRLTKSDLKAIIQHSGATLVPPMDIAEICDSFFDTSAIGRSWRRDIAGLRINNPAVDELLAAIDAQKRAILLTGLPGSGKTCVMLALQEALEERTEVRSDLVSLFIQSREFADLANSEDRQSIGLPEQWVEKSARLADHARVIVVIDSLDVLSIARDHRVLQYFLAQIDRLLLIPNITVVTACRDFDRHYDRRIAERQWGYELKCQPLSWEDVIEPLLNKLEIATSPIDAATRLLIKNPRELALFVELAQREGSFNVVTSQALAQRYLDIIVRANDGLGDAAIQAIEAVAAEMLTQRSLAIPYQRFSASQEVRRILCSLNVLQETQDGKLTFGHQTLLDVLVISGAMRSGATLNEFIQGLPPVPFVRPSIRSFVGQLAVGGRLGFRRQLRAVLTGNAAFHIRRLVAESFAEQPPQDEDWPLIRDLREKHRDVFQVIYALAGGIEWHRFWLNNLVPFLKEMQDAEGLTGHGYRIAQWSNEDTVGVLSYWLEMLSLDWLDCNEIADRLAINLSEIKSENIHLAVPLLRRLLEMPKSEHSFLGRVIAKCVMTSAVGDAWLWSYIADGICDKDIPEYRLGNKLRCQAHEFGDEGKSFLIKRMEQSTVLLDLAIQSIQHWSNYRASRYGENRIEYRRGFLSNTSYEDVHSQRDFDHSDSLDILFEAVEGAVLKHASMNSQWWQENRALLHLNCEGALLYFAILAYTSSPHSNIDLIGNMLCDPRLLEFEFSFELGALIQSAFGMLAAPVQDIVMTNILNMWGEEFPNDSGLWILRSKAELIIAIPCHLRSPAVQAVLDAYEKVAGILIHQPDIHPRGGMVGAPFSFEVFLDSSDSGILRLITHYHGHSEFCGVDFLIGGEREVGWQLREAASRNPSRFLNLLSLHWGDIPDRFRDDIMDGATTYLAHRYGRLQANEEWRPVEEPDASVLAKIILGEIEKHPSQWHRRRSAAKALQVCANVIEDAQAVEKLIFLAIGFIGLYEEDPIHGDSVDLIDLGINMAKGNVSDALMTLANKFLERGNELPELLVGALKHFASDKHAAIRAMILRRLPYFQSKSLSLGWDLFNLAMKESNDLWQVAEPCLYYSYRNNFAMVKPLLARIRDDGHGKDLESWGRISALATMTQSIIDTDFLADLSALDSTAAWEGATTVWANAANIRQHRNLCIAGLEWGLNASAPHALAVAKTMVRIFSGGIPAISVPIRIVQSYFSVLDSDDTKRHHESYEFHHWLNATSQKDPELALAATEIYLEYAGRNKVHIYDYKNSLTQLMTRLFAEAEELEESDSGALLLRVVTMQDTLLSLGVNGIVDWLKAAERP